MLLNSQEAQDKYLQECAREAQRYPQGSPARRRVLDRLVRLVIQSGRLYRPPKTRLPPQMVEAYEEIYSDAKQALMLYLCQNIDRYDPHKASVLGWMNMLMDRRFISVGIQQFQDGRERRLGKRHRLQDLLRSEEDIPAPVMDETDYSLLREYIAEDPEGLLESKKLRNRPEITLKLLLLRKLEDQLWDDMADEFGISLQTLHSFFRRALKSLNPEIQKKLNL